MIHAWIVMPSDAPQIKKLAVARFGGDITFCEPTLASRESTAAEIMERTGAQMIHPYDDDRVIAGQGTAAAEFLEEVPNLDFLLAPVSGGGLLSGTGIAAKVLAPNIKVIGCEPQQADDAARSLASGKLEPASTARTMADGLRATLSPRTFAVLQRVTDSVSLVTEDEIITGMRLLWERLKLVVEPSGAVAAVPALFRKIGAEGKNVGVILSGGNVDLNSLPFGTDRP
jgi:threonine dehydratase